MLSETSSVEQRRQACRHTPLVVEVDVGGRTFRLHSCSVCDWTRWTTETDGPCMVDEVLAAIAGERDHMRGKVSQAS